MDARESTSLISPTPGGSGIVVDALSDVINSGIDLEDNIGWAALGARPKAARGRKIEGGKKGMNRGRGRKDTKNVVDEQQPLITRLLTPRRMCLKEGRE